MCMAIDNIFAVFLNGNNNVIYFTYPITTFRLYIYFFNVLFFNVSLKKIGLDWKKNIHYLRDKYS